MTRNYVEVCSYSFYDTPAALLGSEVIVTDLPDRLRLLRKNIEINMEMFLYGVL